jgi:DNA replication protein DnaC
MCPKCNGTGWVQKKKGEKEYVHKCDCRFLDILFSKSDKANIPKRFTTYKLESYFPDSSNHSQEKAKMIVQKFIDDYPGVDKGLLLQGSIGLGKTQLLCSIATELMKKDDKIDIYYIDWNDLVREMRTGEGHSTRDFTTIQSLMNRLVETEILLFDELASSKVSQWVSDYIYYLINKRYNDNKMTIFATNFYDKSTDGRETLAGRIGERLRSRLYEMAQAVEIRGVDFRQKNL